MAKKKVTEAAGAGKPAANRQLTTQPKAGKALQGASGPVGGRGFENVERKDILIPRIMLLQPLSPAVSSEIAKAGTMHVGLTNVNHGSKIVITPILHFRSRIKWVPRDDGGGIECSSPDAKKPLSDIICTSCAECKFKDWDETKKTAKEQAPECTLYENFLVLIGDSVEPILLPMEKSKAKTAKKFYSMGALKNSDMWNWQYELGVMKDKNDKGDVFYNYTITDLMKPTDAKRRELCEKIWTSLSKKTIVTDMANDDEAAEGAEKSGAPAGEQKF